MSEPYETQNKLGGKFRKLMQERMGNDSTLEALLTLLRYGLLIGLAFGVLVVGSFG